MADSLDVRYQRSLERRLAGLNKVGDQKREDNLLRQKTRAERERIAREEAAQARRDERLNMYDVQGTNQRAGIAADAAYNQQGYTLQRDKQQQIDQLKRDAALHGYSLQRDDRQFGQQMQRDAVQQDYTLNRDDRQQGNTLQRDAIQHGYQNQRDEQQFGQQIQRDVMQDQFSNSRDRAQQKDLLQRDQQQFGQQTFRDRQQNDFQAQRDERLQGFSEQDANRQFGFQQQRDERLQGFDQQNAVQRETFDQTAKWQDQVRQAQMAGLQFSAKDQQEMDQMDRTFRKNVLNNPRLDDGLKQAAMLEHIRQKSSFIPSEKVVRSEDQLKQSLLFDDRVPGVPFMMGYDSQGRPTFEPIGSSGGPKQEDPAKKAEELKKMDFQREKDLKAIAAEVKADTIDPESGDIKAEYMDGKKVNQEKIDAEIARRFAGTDMKYHQYGLPLHDITQYHAQKEEQKMRKQPSQYDRPAPPATTHQGQPAAPPVVNPPVLSSRGSLPSDVSKRLQSIPEGPKLLQLREKHSSNSAKDQFLKQATDIVINFVLTNDTSDPDLAESLDRLNKAGFKFGQ